ncbi:MAG TPA: rhomboid family intramembrane serine protease [Gammaproteobacteria bacterium]|nr:rhomboid family intramembrane serine protease [Gammaproteobacteria bacterium]HQZ87161.1 rhomboid family intramembrane serine protease [Gammaproteobacteria bacterium]HRA42365.1 rhomboid family intramembrane serine protease [Gammaproteobacteria bacterium]
MSAVFIEELDTFIKTSQLYLLPWLYCFAGLWGFNIVNWVCGSPLNIFGIYPRHLFGLLGIIFSPILHKNFNHLFFNSIPLFALGLAILARGLPIFLEVTSVVVVLGGLGVWLFARCALHIGASGLVSGYFGYILATAYFDPSAMALLLAIVVAYYFGSIFLGIFPQEDKISWESHLFGFLAGVASAFHLIN